MAGIPRLYTFAMPLAAPAALFTAAVPLTGAPLPAGLVLLLCAAAGVGTVLLLPSGREGAWRKIGGTIILLAGVIFAALLLRASAGAARAGAGAYFWIFSAIALGAAVRVITHPRPVYSALYFVLTVIASAGLFVLLWAQFMAAALILIYAGAILVTYVFVIMLAAQSGPGPGGGTILADCDIVSREPLAACAIGVALMAVLLIVIFDRAQDLAGPKLAGIEAAPQTISPPGIPAGKLPAAQQEGSTQQLGHYLFEHQLVNVELAGVILAVSMVGAIVIARRRVAPKDELVEPGAEVVRAQFTPATDDPHSIPVYGTQNPRQKQYPES